MLSSRHSWLSFRSPRGAVSHRLPVFRPLHLLRQGEDGWGLAKLAPRTPPRTPLPAASGRGWGRSRQKAKPPGAGATGGEQTARGRCEQAGRFRDRPASSLLGARGAVLLAELVDAALGVERLLLARVERVAGGADLDAEVTARRVGVVVGAARAADVRLGVVGVNALLHGMMPSSVGWVSRGRVPRLGGGRPSSATLCAAQVSLRGT